MIIITIISLICGIISSIELFLSIQKTMETDLKSEKEFENLSLKIYKCLLLDRNNRKEDGKLFLEECFSNYISILANSSLPKKKLPDELKNEIDEIESANVSIGTISTEPSV
jgi:hypothetical protein